MGAHELYLIRREATGHMYTVEATSTKGAMRIFAARYGPPIGEAFRVKLREGMHRNPGEGDWEYYSITSRGLRRRAAR